MINKKLKQIMNKTNVLFFADIIKNKKWGEINFTWDLLIKKLKTKILINIFSFEILKAKFKNFKRPLLKFFQKKMKESFNIFFRKIKFMKCEFFKEEVLRIKNIKKKSEFFSCFLKENDQDLKKMTFSFTFKNLRENFLKFNEIVFKLFPIPKLNYNITIPNCLTFFNQNDYQAKLITFPEYIIPCIKDKTHTRVLYSKISVSFLSFSKNFQKKFSEFRFANSRALIVKNKFFFFSLFFVKKNFNLIFKITKKIYEYFFFLSQFTKMPLYFVKYYNFLEEQEIKKNFITSHPFDKILNQVAILIFEEAIFTGLSYFRLIFSNFLPFLQKIFTRTKEKKFSQQRLMKFFSSKNKKIKKSIKLSFEKVLFENIDAFFSLFLFFNNKLKKKNFSFKSLPKEKIFFLLKSLLKFFFFEKSNFKRLKITMEKKTNKIEIGIKMDEFMKGFYFPMQIMKLRKKELLLRFPLRFRYNFYEIICGTKKTNISNQEIVFSPSLVIDSLFFWVKFSQEIPSWRILSKFHHNSSIKKYSRSLLFMNLWKKNISLKNIEKMDEFPYFFFKEIYWSIYSSKIHFFDIQILSLLKLGEKKIKFLSKIYLIFFIFQKKLEGKRFFRFDFLIFTKIILFKTNFFHQYHYNVNQI